MRVLGNAFSGKQLSKVRHYSFVISKLLEPHSDSKDKVDVCRGSSSSPITVLGRVLSQMFLFFPYFILLASLALEKYKHFGEVKVS